MITRSKIFTLAEARVLIPWLKEISRAAAMDIHQNRLLDAAQEGQSEDAHRQLGRIIHHWAETVRKLGAIPKQPFTVDFDTGKDLLCWEYPEDNIYYRHGYHDGYMGRQRIEENS
jgi:hypothetical protein